MDTWVASPYAPQGVAKPVDGGYIFNGRWQFSSGTDQCDWIILGAMLGDSDGNRTVNLTDIVNVRRQSNTTSAAPEYLWLFDADWNGTVNASDIIEFRLPISGDSRALVVMERV